MQCSLHYNVQLQFTCKVVEYCRVKRVRVYRVCLLADILVHSQEREEDEDGIACSPPKCRNSTARCTTRRCIKCIRCVLQKYSVFTLTRKHITNILVAQKCVFYLFICSFVADTRLYFMYMRCTHCATSQPHPFTFVFHFFGMLKIREKKRLRPN